MTTTLPPAVLQFLKWLVEIAQDREYQAERRGGLVVDGSRLVARTRYTVQQGRNPRSASRDGTAKFKVTKEVTAVPADFEQVHSVFLDLHTKQDWQPNKDDFYPLTTSEIEARAHDKDVNDEYPLTIDFTEPAVKSIRNDLDRLFPSHDDDEEIESDGGDDSPSGGPGDGSPPNGSSGNLRRIARNLYD